MKALTPAQLLNSIRNFRSAHFIASGVGTTSLPSGVTTKISHFAAPGASYFNPGSSFASSRFTCGATDAGAWLFLGYSAIVVPTTPAANAGSQLNLSVNGTGGPFMSSQIPTTGTYGCLTWMPVKLAANATVEVQHFQSTGQTITSNAALLAGIRLSNS